MADKLLDKVSKLLNQAEDEGATPEERESFMAKALELAAANSIDLAVARMHQAKKERVEEVEERTLHVNPRNRRHNKKHFVDLALAIIETNDCEATISGDDCNVHITGFPSDIDVIEALFTHLSVEMHVECDRALQKGENKRVTQVRKKDRIELSWEDRSWGDWNGKTFYDENPDHDVWCYQHEDESDEEFEKRHAEKIEEARQDYLRRVEQGIPEYNGSTDRYRKPVPPPSYREVDVLDDDGNVVYEEKEVSAVDGRVFRSTFYEHFVSRMLGRLREAKASAEREAGALVESSSTALALRDKRKEVKDAYEERLKVGKFGTYTSARETVRKRDHTGAAAKAGTRAAETAALGTSGRGVEKS